MSTVVRKLADERGYIDPGTGSMLFTVAIGLVTAGVYALRSAAVKLRFLMSGGRTDKSDDSRTSLVIFSDSKRYWNVFEPICDELERRAVPCSFMTASPDDPALAKTYQHVKCEFIGEGNKAFAKLNMLKADIVLATTPGLDVYQWKRSRDVKWYVHIPHAVADITMYRMFGIDWYDALLLSGEFQAVQARKLEEAHGSPQKELIMVGAPQMDAWQKRDEQTASRETGGSRTILLAPTWGESSLFRLHGDSAIEALLSTGYHLIVRPHPQSFESEKDMIDGLMARHPESDRIEWNRDNDNFEVLSRSDILVSDFSGVIYDFALIFDRPTIYTKPDVSIAQYDACWLDEPPWVFSSLPKVGKELEANSSSVAIKDLVESCLQDEALRKTCATLRDESWCNRGQSASLIADYLVAKLEELSSEGE